MSPKNKKLILIDSVFIYSQGGINLLKLIINYSRSDKKNYFFLIDYRLKNKIDVNGLKVIFIKPSIFKRHIFYLKNKSSFSSVFCFANLPPTVGLDCMVYTFFQNINILNPYHNKSFSNFLKKCFLMIFKSNTNIWIAQTNYTKKMMIKNKINENDIKVIPFFSDEFNNHEVLNKNKRNKKSKFVNFLYPCDGEKHKNHLRLINAFVKYNKVYKNSQLTLTIDNKYNKILDKINNEIRKGIKIINVGILSKKELHEEYLKTDIILFPSLGESLGLGLIEACAYNIPIFASDLEYVHEIIKPSATFDPLDENKILKTLSLSENFMHIKPELKISNKISEIFNLMN